MCAAAGVLANPHSLEPPTDIGEPNGPLVEFAFPDPRHSNQVPTQIKTCLGDEIVRKPAA
jgi:hypothetical protein